MDNPIAIGFGLLFFGYFVFHIIVHLANEKEKELKALINYYIDETDKYIQSSSIINTPEKQDILAFRELKGVFEHFINRQKNRAYDREKDESRSRIKKLKAKLKRLEEEHEDHKYISEHFFPKPCQHGVKFALLNVQLCNDCYEIYKIWQNFCKDDGSKFNEEEIKNDIVFFREKLKTIEHERQINNIIEKGQSYQYPRLNYFQSYNGLKVLNFRRCKDYMYSHFNIRDFNAQQYHGKEYREKLSEYYLKKIDDEERFTKEFLMHECQHGVKYAFFVPSKCHICEKMYEIWNKSNMAHYEDEELEKMAIQEIEEQEREERLQKEREEKEKQFRIKNEQIFIYRSEHGWKKGLSQEEIKKEIGARYERYIGYLYEIQGYDVRFNGVFMGKKDNGIDILATKKDEIIVIQCKNIAKEFYNKETNEMQDKEIHIRHAQGVESNTRRYMRKNKNCTVKGIIYTVYDNLDKESKELLEELQEDGLNIEHQVLPYDNTYPLIKCNIGKGGQKIYHLPVIGMYDRIKIEVNKGEFYVQTVEEAEELGFRAVNWNTK